jgi:hypothetical protein
MGPTFWSRVASLAVNPEHRAHAIRMFNLAMRLRYVTADIHDI